MAFGSGKHTISLEDIMMRVSEFDILQYYFNVSVLPTVIQSPLRKDNHPSFGLYTKDGIRVKYVDFATKESGGLLDLLMKYWGENYSSTLDRIWEDLPNFSTSNSCFKPIECKKVSVYNKRYSKTELKCKVREWKDYDIRYWESYGITLEWLKFADVYPISHKIVVKDSNLYVFGADKYAYLMDQST